MRKHEVRNCGWVRTLALRRKCNSYLGEETLYCGGRRRATQILPRHQCDVWELTLILTPPSDGVFLGLVINLRQCEILGELVLLRCRRLLTRRVVVVII